MNDIEHRLLHPISDAEETRRSNIRDWLYANNISNRVEYQTEEGPADIYLPNRRVMIEVKRKGHADPYSPHGSRSGETPLDQISRYINAERIREIRGLDDSDDTSLEWLGIITDSEIWYAFKLTDVGFKSVIEWDGKHLDDTKSLKKLLDRKVGKEWAPDDPTHLFLEPLKILNKTYQEKKDFRDVITQRELWYRQLKISGNHPKESHKEELFILHTLLIVISAKISEMYGDVDIRYGFASWVKKTDWLKYIDNVIKQYNWRQSSVDTLRAIYMGLVDKEDRHIYGEYYTPDWLAEKICLDVIDDKYIEGMVRGDNVGGVMDPACGSGTFLYHAVRRIINSTPVTEATMNNHDITNMIIDTIHGVDIHPVAVAMSKANILRALPSKPETPLQIYQGDSLRLYEDKQQKIIDLENQIFEVVSREGKKICFPLEFILSDNFDGNMHRFVKAAVNGKQFPPRLDSTIKEKARKEILYKAFTVLSDICKEEGNDIWAWYVINSASVYLLKEKISRMIGNPPWVRMSSIQDEKRKNVMENLAKELKLWTGGKLATGFNIASLFVLHCQKIYGKSDVVSGWVLPDAAMKGSNWSKYNKLVKPTIYDLGRLAFPEQSDSCVNLLGVKDRNKKLLLKTGKKILDPKESWSIVSEKTKWRYIKKTKSEKSAWFENNKPIAKNGATLTPSCLVVLDNPETKRGMVIGKTKKSRHGNWKGKSFDVKVPESAIRQCVFGTKGLLPYLIRKTRSVILPINDDGTFKNDRDEIEWWRDATDIYKHNKGIGGNTPKTLEEQLNYKMKLEKQLPVKKHVVIYNSSGSNMCAARLVEPFLINHSLYRVVTKSKNESLFLIAILNADCLNETFRKTKKSDRHFDTQFWHEIPIPRYNSKNELHKKLVRLSKRAEDIAKTVENPSYNTIKETLRDDGISSDIDNVVLEIIPSDYIV